MVGDLEGRRRHGLDQPDEPGAGARPTCSRTPARTVLVSLEALYREVARGGRAGHRRADWCSRPASWTSRPATTSGSSPASSGRARGDDGHRRVAASDRGQAPPPVDARPGRRRVPDLHLGHDRRAQGRDEHPPQRGVHRPGLPRLGRSGRDDVVLGIAPLFHITGLIGHIAVALLVAGAAGAGLPVRAAGRRRRLPRAPADVHHRRDHRVHRAAERAGRHEGRASPRSPRSTRAARRSRRRAEKAFLAASGTTSTTSTGSPRPRRR